MGRRLHMVGNWKMNQTVGEIKRFFEEFNKAQSRLSCNYWIAPQFIHIPLLQELGGNTQIGAQNCSHQDNGAFTGDISPKSLKDMGVSFTLIGHSERRAFFGESDSILNEKVKKALANQLTAIFCVGETLAEREAERTEVVIKRQLDEGLKGMTQVDLAQIIIAYEPVWAIGTGKTATPDQAQEVHAFIREHLAKQMKFKTDDLIILYGGSVNPANVADLLAQPDIDGGLVGGASLKAPDFIALCEAASR